MTKRRKTTAPLITNLPEHHEYDGGAPDDPIIMEIFTLRRRVTDLTNRLTDANKKLTRALECLQGLHRFFFLWVYEGQGESYDEIMTRMGKISSTVEIIQAKILGPYPEAEVPQKWQKAQGK